MNGENAGVWVIWVMSVVQQPDVDPTPDENMIAATNHTFFRSMQVAKRLSLGHFCNADARTSHTICEILSSSAPMIYDPQPHYMHWDIQPHCLHYWNPQTHLRVYYWAALCVSVSWNICIIQKLQTCCMRDSIIYWWLLMRCHNGYHQLDIVIWIVWFPTKGATRPAGHSSDPTLVPETIRVTPVRTNRFFLNDPSQKSSGLVKPPASYTNTMQKK